MAEIKLAPQNENNQRDLIYLVTNFTIPGKRKAFFKGGLTIGLQDVNKRLTLPRLKR